MIKSLSVINPSGDRLDIILKELVPEHGLLVREIQGLGPAKANINTTPLVTSDGTVYNSARLDERNIVLDLVFNCLSIEEARLITYKFFPIKQMVDLIVVTDNREAICTGFVESNEPDIFSDQESTQISIICPDPYFYDASIDGNAFISFSTVEPLFEFPFENNSLEEKLMEFGNIVTFNERSIYYRGDAPTGVLCHFHFIGPVTGNINIYNITLNKMLTIKTDIIKEVTGLDVKAGMDIMINTVPGKRSATLIAYGIEYNILNAVVRDSEWFIIYYGDNVFTFFVDEGVENVQFSMKAQIVYEGV